MTPAVLYAAKSSPDEKESTLDQLAQLRAHLAGLDVEIVGEFSEENVSGYHGSRGPQLEAAMRRAIEEADTHGSAELWVFHSSRLARGSGLKAEARSLLEVFTHLRRSGVTLRSLGDDPYVTDEAFIGMASKMANKYSEDLSAHTRRGKRAAAAKGRPHGGIPAFGYRYEGRREECRLVPDPAEAAIVRRIFESYAAGESQLAILRALNEDGVPTKRGARRWAQGTLVAILRNPLYTGKVRHQGELYDGEHEALIPLDLWQRVEALRAANDSRPGRGRGRPPKGTHLLTRGLLRCSHCDSAMVARGNRYLCVGRIENGPAFCLQEPVARDAIDTAVLRYFETVGLDVEATREAFQHSLDAKLGEIAALRAQAHGDALKKHAWRDRIEADYAAGEISGAGWEKLSAKVDAELEALTAQIAQLDTRERQVRDEADYGDAEGAMLECLTEIRAAVAGDVRSADGVEAVRAALASLFESFTLNPRSRPIAQMLGLASDRQLDAALAAMKGGSLDDVERIAGQPVSAVDPIDTDAAGGYMIVPRVRREALEGLDGFKPILRKMPLSKRANNHSTANAVHGLFGPIPIEAPA